MYPHVWKSGGAVRTRRTLSCLRAALQRRGRARWLKSNREEAAPLVLATRSRALPARLRVRLGPSRRIERSGQRQNRRHPESVSSLRPKAMVNRSEPPSHPGLWSALGTTERPFLSSWTNYLKVPCSTFVLAKEARTSPGRWVSIESALTRDHFRLASGSLLVRRLVGCCSLLSQYGSRRVRGRRKGDEDRIGRWPRSVG